MILNIKKYFFYRISIEEWKNTQENHAHGV